jgi:hypothetical protein
MNGARARKDRYEGQGPDSHGFAERFRSWRRRTRRLAWNWAVALADGTSAGSSGLHAALAREIEAYARRLVWARLRTRRAAPTHRIGPAGDQVVRHLLLADSGGRPPSCTPEAEPTPDPGDTPGSSLVQGASPRPYQPPAVTRETFERFCRWTGMDPGCLVGPEDHQAGLVFYLVVFAMLTDPGGSPDLRSIKLLEQLRLCREDLNRHAQGLFRSAATGFRRTTAGSVGRFLPPSADAAS